MYEMLTSKHPFEAADIKGLMKKVTAGGAPSAAGTGLRRQQALGLRRQPALGPAAPGAP